VKILETNWVKHVLGVFGYKTLAEYTNSRAVFFAIDRRKK